ncbi:unnamed protein product [Rhizopus stolonifer]
MSNQKDKPRIPKRINPMFGPSNYNKQLPSWKTSLFNTLENKPSLLSKVYKQKQRILKPFVSQEENKGSQLDTLTDSYKKQYGQNQKMFDEVERQVNELKKTLKEKQEAFEKYQRLDEIKNSFDQLESINSNKFITSVDKLTNRMNTFKGVFFHLEELIKQIETIKTKENQVLRKESVANIKKIQEREGQIKTFKKQLQQLIEKSQEWMNQGLERVYGYSDIQHYVLELVNFINEHYKHMISLKEVVGTCSVAFQDLSVHVKDVLYAIESCLISSSRIKTLVSDIKLNAQVQRYSFNVIFKSIEVLEAMTNEFIQNEMNLNQKVENMGQEQIPSKNTIRLRLRTTPVAVDKPLMDLKIEEKDKTAKNSSTRIKSDHDQIRKRKKFRKLSNVQKANSILFDSDEEMEKRIERVIMLEPKQ